jgi:DNA (cytosine-5)-methyltransferase 1
MTCPKMLDLYACAGGAGMGYHRSGFDVYAVDIEPQPNNPFPFHQGDALEVLCLLILGGSVDFTHRDGTVEWLVLEDFTAAHGSPPCQGYLNLSRVNEALGREVRHERLIAQTRALLVATGLPYVIENVQDARKELQGAVRICGTGLHLPIRRHRLFESNLPLEGIACAHHRYTEPKYWTSWRPKGQHRLSTVVQVYGNGAGKEHWPAALGIDWMTAAEMVEAIPPAYTQHIGTQLLEHVTADVAA